MHKIKEGLLDAHYLINRALYPQAERQLKKLKKQAYKYQNYLALVEIIAQQLRILNSMQGAKDEKTMEVLIAEQQNVLEIVSKKRQYLELFYRIKFKISKNRSDPATVPEIENLLHLLQINPDNPSFPAVERLYYKATQQYLRYFGDYTKILLLLKSI